MSGHNPQKLVGAWVHGLFYCSRRSETDEELA